MSVLQRCPHLLVTVLLKGIQVEAQRAREEDRILRGINECINQEDTNTDRQHSTRRHKMHTSRSTNYDREVFHFTLLLIKMMSFSFVYWILNVTCSFWVVDKYTSGNELQSCLAQSRGVGTSKLLPATLNTETAQLADLWDNGQTGSQILQAHTCNVNTIDGD